MDVDHVSGHGHLDRRIVKAPQQVFPAPGLGDSPLVDLEIVRAGRVLDMGQEFRPLAHEVVASTHEITDCPHVESLAQDKGNIFIAAEVTEPVPGEHTFPTDDDILTKRLDFTCYLQEGSPAIDTGRCGKWIYILGHDFYERIAPTDDIDGDNKPGGRVPIGCNIGADERRIQTLSPAHVPADDCPSTSLSL